MKVKCPGCEKVINVPDDKIPDKGALKFNCPNCKGPVSVSRDTKNETDGILPDLGDLPEKTPTPQPLDETQDIPIPQSGGGGLEALPDLEGALEDGLDMLEEGKFRALVADKDNLHLISPVLKKMQYVVTPVKSAEEAIQKLTFNVYDVVIINEKFEECDPANNPIHKHIEPMTMDIRRKMFVVLTGKNFKTMDSMASFNLSVNLVMNESDFGNFELILKKTMKDNEIFYHVFNMMQIETGKEIAM